MSVPFDSILGKAYSLSVLQSRKGEAIATLKAAFSNNEGLASEAQHYLTDKASVKRERCFIVATNVDLLKAALA